VFVIAQNLILACVSPFYNQKNTILPRFHSDELQSMAGKTSVFDNFVNSD